MLHTKFVSMLMVLPAYHISVTHKLSLLNR